jgi:hypothetical protein
MALLSLGDCLREMARFEDDCPASVAVSNELDAAGGNDFRPIQHTERSIFPSVVGKHISRRSECYLVGLRLGWGGVGTHKVIESLRNGYTAALKRAEGFAAGFGEAFGLVIDGQQVQKHGHLCGGSTVHAAGNGRKGPRVEGRRDGTERRVGGCGHGVGVLDFCFSSHSCF